MNHLIEKLFIDDESQQDDGFNNDNNNKSNDASTSNQVQRYIKVNNNEDELK